jgi:hypothetical protein
VLNKLFNRYVFLNTLFGGVFVLLFWMLMTQNDDPVSRRGYGTFVVYGILILILSYFLIGIVSGETIERFKKAYRWLGLWHLRVFGIVASGGVLGSILFLVVGSLFKLDYSSTELLKNGLLDGAFYALLWAPGISLIWCIIIAKKESDAQKSKMTPNG